MNAISRAALCLLAVLPAACSSPVRVQRRLDTREAAYESAAEASVPSFHFTNLYSWEALGERHAAVYTGPDQVWLLDFAQPCPGLERDGAIVLTSYGNEVAAGHDRIEAKHLAGPCPISRVRPVVAARLRKLQTRQLEIRSAPRPGRQLPAASS